MALHVDAPGMGNFGGADFSSGDLVTDAVEEADALDAAFDASQNGGGALPLVVSSGGSSASVPMPPPPFPDASGVPDPTSSPGPSIAGGRPPSASPFVPAAGPGSASAAAGSLLASLFAAGAAGYYFRDPKAAAAGFLVTGSAFNLYHGQRAATSPTPTVAQEGTWSTVAAAVGLGLGCYLAYGVYQGTK